MSSTGFAWLDRKMDAFDRLPPGTIARRLGYAFLVALGITLTGYGSFVFSTFSAPIPYGVIPDLRGAALLLSGLFLGAYAAYGDAGHRRWALWGVLAFVIGFHLEEALVHWIGPYPGSITGSSVGILGTAGSILALAGVALLHVEVESARLAGDLQTRGADREQSLSLVGSLRGEGSRRVWALSLGVAALGGLALVSSKAFGNDGKGGEYILVLGAGLLAALAVMLVLVGRKR